MKLLNTIAVFLVACSCALGQSASTILSSLRIKGATSEGGDPKYENYIPRLDTNGTISLSFLPPSMYTNIYEYINIHGSEFDQEQIRIINDNIDNVVARQLSEEITNVFNYIDITAYTITNSIPSFEEDPVFESFVTNNGVSIGFGAVSSTNGAYQIGTGTNNVPDTLKFMGTTIVGTDGCIPREVVPWAAVDTNIFDKIDNLYSNKVSIYGDKMSGEYTYTAGKYAAIIDCTNAEPVNVHGVLIYTSANSTNAEFVGEIVVDSTGDLQNGGRFMEYIRKNDTVYATERGEFRLSFSCFGGSVTNTVNFSVNNRMCTISGTDGRGESFEITSEFTSVTPVRLENVFVELFKHMNLRNPHGLELHDIVEPVEFFEMKTAGGKIYRYWPDEDGSIKYTRVK